jgi:hypothetical protein
MNKRSRKKQSSWESSSWWAHTPVRYFEPLICFASQEIDEANWKEAIWQALGREKFSDVTYRTNDGRVHKRIWAADISPDEAITEVKRVIPTIFGQEATLQLAKQLRGRVTQILDFIVAKTAAVERQRGGKEGIAWIERSKENDVVFRLTGEPTGYMSLPWHCTHFAEHEEIVRMIRDEFGMSDTRYAVIHNTGFLCFDDEGKDAARTLSWALIGLVDGVFNREKAILKKCLSCEGYFFHPTFRPKKFCSKRCHDNYHNDYR